MTALFRSIQPLVLLLLPMLALTWGSAQAEVLTIEADRQLHYARSLVENRQFLRAAEAYQRFAFFFPDHPKKRQAVFEAGKAFMLARDVKTAQTQFKALIADGRLDPLAVEAHFALAESYLRLGAHTHAVVRLNNLIALSDDPVIDDRAYHHIGWIQLEATDWPGALKAFERISPNGRTQYQVASLIASLNRSGDIVEKDPALAGILSVVPGAGQLYCRRYKDAAVAFVLSAGTIWAALDAFDNDQNALGGLLTFIGIGFYAGNIYGAINDAHKFNTYEKRRFVDSLKQQYPPTSGMSPQASFQGMYVGVRISF